MHGDLPSLSVREFSAGEKSFGSLDRLSRDSGRDLSFACSAVQGCKSSEPSCRKASKPFVMDSSLARLRPAIILTEADTSTDTQAALLTLNPKPCTTMNQDPDGSGCGDPRHSHYFFILDYTVLHSTLPCLTLA